MPVDSKLGGLHGGIFIAILVVSAAAFPALAWPWYLLAPLGAYAGLVLAIPPLRRTAPRFHAGRIAGLPLAGALLLSAATVGVLVVFDWLLQPQTSQLAARIPVAPFGNVVLAGVCFSIVNAAMEELVFRGVLYESLARDWGATAAIVVTAAIFGLAHVHGYPPGPLGGILAAGFGIALGILRWWTGGLALAIACHVLADATIFGLLAAAGAFATRIQPLT
ncbi:MAG: CPBP family intramembrane metalloprotease [Planctomycetes bacterium]|nr:CPBP family intramembrane metalloprotease [Planctomycetota bacterium]